MWIGLIGVNVGSMAGSCEHGSEHSGPMKGCEILGLLNDYYFIKVSATWS